MDDVPSTRRYLSSLPDRAGRTLASERAAQAALVFVVVIAVLAPLGPLAGNRFHHDEAIYSSWSLDIASRRDLMVSGSPVDKPPLFLYLQALSFVLFGATEAAARLPSLVAGAVSVVLVYRLGQRLYGRGNGLLAAFLLAVSPFAILFASTAFTDTLMTAFVLAACLSIVEAHWGWGGVLLGLAAMTKQQGILFLPLVVGMGYFASPPCSLSPRWKGGWGVRFAVGLALMLGATITWDLARGRQPGFLEQSLLSYSTLSLEPAMLWQRLSGFIDTLRYSSGSPLLNWLLAGGLPLLLATDILWLFGSVRAGRTHDSFPDAGTQRPGDQGGEHARWRHYPGVAERADLVIVSFAALFLLGHSLVAFQVWDRYLLGLIPLLALLLARVVTWPWRLYCAVTSPSPRASGQEAVGAGPSWRPRLLYGLAIVALLAATLGPLQDAAASRFPVGGDHGAYDGIEQVVDYFKAVPADTTFYHRWLGSHWRFYLWGSPYDFRVWTSPDDLAAQAAARPGVRRYVVFPSWQSSTETRLALEQVGLGLREVYRTLRRDGSVSFLVYRIEEAQ